ncbi:MAG TPA: prolipoprotein diacylglyceryl transferase family protein, partial [Dongiaceae bacterium]|nr:prolipoprotein diacylglyceryl transferase family protein [Dongiaceae bacterium]
PRHPSQLYQAGLEGLLLFGFMLWAARQQWMRERLGMLTGLFLMGYAVARSIGEIFREPEVNLGAWSFVTWGQILSVPMFLFGLYLVLRKPRNAPADKSAR